MMTRTLVSPFKDNQNLKLYFAETLTIEVRNKLASITDHSKRYHPIISDNYNKREISCNIRINIIITC